MSQEQKRPASKKAPRTQIADLAPPVEELSEGEASLATGGAIGRIEARFPSLTTDATQAANTCTAGNALQGSDSDYASD